MNREKPRLRIDRGRGLEEEPAGAPEREGREAAKLEAPLRRQEGGLEQATEGEGHADARMQGGGRARTHTLGEQQAEGMCRVSGPGPRQVVRKH